MVIVMEEELQKKIDLLEQELILLKEINKQLASAVKNSPASIVITDKDGNIQYVNPMFTEITGYTLSDAMGKNPRILQSGCHPKVFYKELWDTLNSGNVWHGEFFNKKKNGDFYWEQANIAPVKNKDGEITNYVAIKLDITQRIQAEQKLKELVATKDKLFSIIAHHLKNPFSAIVGFSSILSENIEIYKPEQIHHISSVINDASQRAAGLVENLLNWSLAQTGSLEFHPQKLVLRQLIGDVVKDRKSEAQKKQISLLNEVPELMEVFAEIVMLKTIIRNLISNAIKYSNSGGQVKINAVESTDYIEITVSDTGIGIPPEGLEKLFMIDSKYNTIGTFEEQGIGLGLILCKELVEKHGGKIWANSEIEKGSEFKFTISKPK
jgi:hypothetical protein